MNSRLNLGSMRTLSVTSRGIQIRTSYSSGVVLVNTLTPRVPQSSANYLGADWPYQERAASSWHVIVSVRTYDARKSQELQQMFPQRSENAPTDNFQLHDIRCRHFYIPELTDGEVEAAVKSIPHLPDVYSSGSVEFKDLLKTPFNLWLLEQLLRENADIPELSDVASEVQLLGLFWQYRITSGTMGGGKSMLLNKIASFMVTAEILCRCEKTGYLTSPQKTHGICSSAPTL